MYTEQLDALLKPKAIAVVGASDKASSWSLEIHSNLEGFGYPGQIFPVNPRRARVWGREAFKSLKDVPEEVELAIIAIPAAAAVDAVSACGEKHIPAAMVVSSGFRDAGEEGAIIQEQLVAAATNGNVAVLGPNVEGFINYRDRVAGYGAELPPTSTVGSISMFSQSGTAAWAFAHMAGDRGAGLRLVAGVGVEATLGIGDLLVWAAADPETSVAACYIETIRDLSRFSRGLDAMARASKRVVLCCPAASGEAARRSVIAHTGELIGDTTLRDAFFRRSGAILVNDPIALFETTLLLESAAKPASAGVAVAMQSGGNCTLFADALEDAGIPLNDFSPATTDKLAEILPAFSEPRNPLDVTGQAIFDHKIYRDSITVLADDPRVGIVVIDVAPSRRDPDGSLSTEILKHAGEVQRSTRKPVISVLATPLSYPGRTTAPLSANSLTVLHGHAASAQAIAGLISASEPRRRIAERTIDRPELSIPAGILDETQAAAIFAAYHIERPRELVASTPDRVAEAAQQLGGRVVVKLICASIPHKAREGLVKLGLDTPADARAAAQQVQDRARERGVDGSRLLVQEQLPPGPEFLLGVTVDELYGPALTVRPGGGGVAGESKFQLLPLARGEAAEIAARAAAEISQDLSKPDLRALTEAVDHFSWLGFDLADRLLEIEANPIIITGGRAVAVDALAVARDESGES
jgi:acyl-CoA synthetase (NDP forming)